MPSFKHIESAILPTAHGAFQAHVFSTSNNQSELLALSYGAIHGKKGILTRIHSSCMTGDIFGSRRCDCGPQLHLAMDMIVREACGLIIYLSQEGRGIGLTNKIRAYALQDAGKDTVDANLALGFAADERNYSACAEIFSYFDINNVRLLSNNPHKIQAIQKLGIEVQRVAVQTSVHSCNRSYLQVKRDRLGHLLDL